MVRVRLLVLSGLLLLPAAIHAQSALDGFNPNANGAIRVVFVQPDGRILIGGAFTTLAPNGGPTVTRNHIARLNPDGTVDTAFDPNANDVVRAFAIQADGKILVGGQFNGPNSIGGQTRNRIARLDPVTGAADSFDPDANDIVFAIAIQPDGKILVGGDFNGPNSVGGQMRSHIARLDPVTGAADSLDPNASQRVLSIVRQADGRILTGGEFTFIGGQSRNRIARLDPATGAADSFDPNANSSVYAIAIQADGKILAGGFFNGPNSIGGQERDHIARLDPVTGLADSFDPSADARVISIAVQSDGQILAGGDFQNIGGQPRNRLARLDSVTGLSDALDPGLSMVRVYSLAVQPDGKILVGGDPSIVRLEVDGRLDQTLTSVASRKVHNSSPFDITLPSNGSGVECRGSGDGNYTIVFSFANTLTSVENAAVTSGTGSVSSRMMDADSRNYIVNLADVADDQTLAVTLTNVNDSASHSSTSISISFGVLQGDTNGDGVVNSADIAQTKSKSGQSVDITNFRNDVNVDGTLNSADVGLVKSKSGTALP